MLTDDMKVISVDDHVFETPGTFIDRVPAKFRDAAPRLEERPGKIQVWVWEGREYLFESVGSPTSRIFRTDGTGDDYYGRHFDDVIPACYEPHARLKAMDEDGVWAQLSFPSFCRFAGTRFLEGNDKELALECVVAYNDWMIDEWCAVDPERLIPLVILPLWDVSACVKEIERTVAKGARAVSVPESPVPLGLPSVWTKYWDPLFAAAQEADVPLCTHTGTSGSLVMPSPETTEPAQYSLSSINAMMQVSDLIFSHTFDRFPQLKIAMSEAGSGWVPYLGERMDFTWERTRVGADRLDIAPSKLLHDHFWTCFIKDDVGIKLRHDIGLDRLMFETDFPHQDSNYPHSRKVLADMMLDVPDDEVRQIVETNARELFKI
jgi:predicted TIM-barrel fold metal-dependent hydrolase